MSQGFQNFSNDTAYSRPFDTQPPKKSIGIWIMLGALFVGGVAVCGCCGGVMYFTLGVISTEIANDLRDNPVMREHVGEIQSFDINFTASAAEPDDDVYVFDVVGDKGTGTATVKSITDEDGNEQIVWATLRTSDGTTFDLVTE
jgi:hypothetical protein